MVDTDTVARVTQIRRLRGGLSDGGGRVPGAAACGDPLPEVDGDFAFVGVNVLPMRGPNGAVALENQTVVVANRRIASISPSDTVEVADGVEVVEAEGQFLMPGLAEMHGHLPGRPLLPLDVKNLLFLYVANGVTTVRGMQGNRSQFTMRDQIARGETIGPRLFVGSTAMSGTRVTTPQQGAQLVREYQQNGYDLVKIHEGLTAEVFDAVAVSANELGMPFGGHVPDEVGLWRALDAGQTSIDHLDNYVEALVPDEALPAGRPGSTALPGSWMSSTRPRSPSWSEPRVRPARGSCPRWCCGRQPSTASSRPPRSAKSGPRSNTCRQKWWRSGTVRWRTGSPRVTWRRIGGSATCGG